MRNGTAAAAILGLTLALGLAAAGYFVGNALYAVRASERFVTVKGFAEKEVRANLAMWPIVFNTTGNELAELQRDIDTAAKAVIAFLERNGFSTNEFSISSPRVTDFATQGRPGPDNPPYRYAAESVVTLRSEKVDQVKEAIQHSGELIKAGIALVRSYEFNTTFLYTDLEKIKPEMIAEATKDARRAAEQFATDSGSRVGAIRNAQQGYFNIEDRDPFSPEFKKIRVVTTVQYLLVED